MLSELDDTEQWLGWCMGGHIPILTLQTWDLASSFSTQRKKQDPSNAGYKTYSDCWLAILKLLSNACARGSLCASHTFCFHRGKQANKTWPCQWLESSMKMLWSSLISPCWCSVVIAVPSLFLWSDFVLYTSCRFAGFSRYCQINK